MIHDNAVTQVDNETIVVCPRTRTLFVCFAHYFIGFVMRITVGILVEK